MYCSHEGINFYFLDTGSWLETMLPDSDFAVACIEYCVCSNGRDQCSINDHMMINVPEIDSAQAPGRLDQHLSVIRTTRIAHFHSLVIPMLAKSPKSPKSPRPSCQRASVYYLFARSTGQAICLLTPQSLFTAILISSSHEY